MGPPLLGSPHAWPGRAYRDRRLQTVPGDQVGEELRASRSDLSNSNDRLAHPCSAWRSCGSHMVAADRSWTRPARAGRRAGRDPGGYSISRSDHSIARSRRDRCTARRADRPHVEAFRSVSSGGTPPRVQERPGPRRSPFKESEGRADCYPAQTGREGMGPET